MMMKKLLFAAFMAACTTGYAQEIWKFKAESQAEKINLNIDLYNESIEVPTMEMFGPMNGYIQGKGVYGVWMVTSVKINSEKEATIHLSNDLGSETQAVRLTLKNDSICTFEQIDGNVIKKVVGRKLVKIPKKIQLQIKIGK